jgi:hypothetical protein
MIISFISVIAYLLFISTFGIHILILNSDKWEQPPYTDHPILSLIPWISGYVFSVVPIVMTFHLNWIAVFFINILVTKYLGAYITHGYLKRFASGKGLAKDLISSFFSAFIILIILTILKLIL